MTSSLVPTTGGTGARWWRRLVTAVAGGPGLMAVAALTGTPGVTMILATAQRPLTPQL